MKPLNQSTPITLQERLYYDLSERIKNGEYKPGDRIPTESQLSELYNVSRVTVRGALKQMADENILIKKHGKGTFVKSSAYVESGYISPSFTEACRAMGANPSTKIISCRQYPGDKNILDALGSDSDILIEIVRVRLLDNIPCILEIDYLPDKFQVLLKENLENRSLIQTITNFLGEAPCRFQDHFRICFANKKFAQFLECPTSTPLLEVEQKRYTITRQIVYINKQYILTDKYVYSNAFL